MKWTRRELPLLLPALATAQTGAEHPALPSKAYRFEDLEAHKSGAITLRQILNGDTHSGYALDLHESELPAGQAPHPPHRHVHEEMLLIRDGVMEVIIEGRATRLGPGSAAYISSNQEHGYRNPGTAPVAYFVLALGSDKA
jgi:quercetin dioxygenase-like cupin family protein